MIQCRPYIHVFQLMATCTIVHVYRGMHRAAVSPFQVNVVGDRCALRPTNRGGTRVSRFCTFSRCLSHIGPAFYCIYIRPIIVADLCTVQQPFSNLKLRRLQRSLFFTIFYDYVFFTITITFFTITIQDSLSRVVLRVALVTCS